ncbi:hypothetical protein NC651_021508 [Populus alba x Populus x berolinensis]|nr:hypothetical protein NC651_021508 [Populus alba x Populus x berolinensis]
MQLVVASSSLFQHKISHTMFGVSEASLTSSLVKFLGYCHFHRCRHLDGCFVYFFFSLVVVCLFLYTKLPFPFPLR